jgi:hypothetical protein
METSGNKFDLIVFHAYKYPRYQGHTHFLEEDIFVKTSQSDCLHEVWNVDLPVHSVTVNPPQCAAPNVFLLAHVQLLVSQDCCQLLYWQFKQLLTALRHLHKMAQHEESSGRFKLRDEVRPTAVNIGTGY